MRLRFNQQSSRRRPSAGALAGIVGLLLAAGPATTILAQDATPMASPEAGVVLASDTLSTSRSYFIASDPAKYEVTPILTSGEMVGDYQFAGIPDGTGIYKDANGDIVLFVNHEWTPKEAGSDEGDLSGGRISRLVLGATTGAVKSGEYVLDGSEGYWDTLLSNSLR